MELHMPHTHLHESYITVYLHTLILVIMESTHRQTHTHTYACTQHDEAMYECISTCENY